MSSIEINRSLFVTMFIIFFNEFTISILFWHHVMLLRHDLLNFASVLSDISTAEWGEDRGVEEAAWQRRKSTQWMAVVMETGWPAPWSSVWAASLCLVTVHWCPWPRVPFLGTTDHWPLYLTLPVPGLPRPAPALTHAPLPGPRKQQSPAQNNNIVDWPRVPAAGCWPASCCERGGGERCVSRVSAARRTTPPPPPDFTFSQYWVLK